MGRAYAGVDGYCPLATYLGSHGFCPDLALRPGAQYSAAETDFNLHRIIPMAQRLSAAGHGTQVGCADPVPPEFGIRLGTADVRNEATH